MRCAPPRPGGTEPTHAPEPAPPSAPARAAGPRLPAVGVGGAAVGSRCWRAGFCLSPAPLSPPFPSPCPSPGPRGRLSSRGGGGTPPPPPLLLPLAFPPQPPTPRKPSARVPPLGHSPRGLQRGPPAPERVWAGVRALSLPRLAHRRGLRLRAGRGADNELGFDLRGVDDPVPKRTRVFLRKYDGEGGVAAPEPGAVAGPALPAVLFGLKRLRSKLSLVCAREGLL